MSERLNKRVQVVRPYNTPLHAAEAHSIMRCKVSSRQHQLGHRRENAKCGYHAAQSRRFNSYRTFLEHRNAPFAP